ncbi:MAG: bacillithiol system redox-active protein YtxJ [Planctomycetota bacterium]
MTQETLPLPPETDDALEVIRLASRSRPVLVFKRSPICPVSFAAEAEYRAFLGDWSGALATAVIDVIAERPLARGLTAALGVRHESPQALVFRDGALSWHDSHEGIDRESLGRACAAAG